jgi:hypothetical protein
MPRARSLPKRFTSFFFTLGVILTNDLVFLRGSNSKKLAGGWGWWSVVLGALPIRDVRGGWAVVCTCGGVTYSPVCGVWRMRTHAYECMRAVRRPVQTCSCRR